MSAPRIQTRADLKLRAFSNGYKSAMDGKAIHENPFHTEEMKSSWLAGWREFEEKKRKANNGSNPT